MNILSETYIFYADVYFVQNFIIKIAVLYLSLYSNKLHIHTLTLKGCGKICLVSFLGTVFEIVGLLLGSSYNLFLVLVHVLEIPLMFLGVLGKEMRHLFSTIIAGYFFVMLINGVLEILWNWFGQGGNYILLLLFTCGIVIAGVRIWQNCKKMQKGIFLVELVYQDKRISTYAFYDSGNRLVDPYTGKGVHIVSETLFKKMDLDRENAVFVPYQTLGNEEGIVEVYYVDELTIEGEKQRIKRQKCPLGVTKETLFQEKSYEMIINEEVF